MAGPPKTCPERPDQRVPASRLTSKIAQFTVQDPIFEQHRITATVIARHLLVGRSTLYRALDLGHSLSRYGGAMTAQPATSPEPAVPYEVIHLGGEAAAIVPLAELRRLRAVERHASPQALEDAEVEATLAAHDEWVAAGCPGALSHEEVMAGLLGSDG